MEKEAKNFRFNGMPFSIVFVVLSSILIVCINFVYVRFKNHAVSVSTISEITENIDVNSDDYIFATSDSFVKVDTRAKKDVINFVGDIIMTDRPRKSYEEGGIDTVIDLEYKRLLYNSDYNVGNLETVITDDIEYPIDKTFNFALPTKYVDILKDLKINLFTIANNHILDYGADGLLNTLKVLDENGFSHIGAGKDKQEAEKLHIEEIDGKMYAFIAASAVVPDGMWLASSARPGVCDGHNTIEIGNTIARAKKYVDKVIVYMHWGTELDMASNKTQQYIARELVDAGADLIVGSHSHTIQEIEYYNDVPIIYSLGNFVYGGTSRDTILLQAIFDYSKNKSGDISIKVYPGRAGYHKVSKTTDKNDLILRLNELREKSVNCTIYDDGSIDVKEILDD